MPNALFSALKMKDIRQRMPYASESSFFKHNPEVTGMAAEDNAVILNPFSKLTEQEKESVLMNERARVIMRLMGAPNFYVTPEQQSKFKNYGNKDDVNSTIAARIFSGDKSAGQITKEQWEYVLNNLMPFLR